MLDGHMVELMQRAADGEATAEETAKLHAHLESDAESRAIWETLEAAHRALRGVGLVEAPAEWMAGVVRRIHSFPTQVSAGAVRRSGKETGSARFFAWLGPLKRRGAPRTALAFAAGAACGIALLSTSRRADHLQEGAPGTLLPRDRIVAERGEVTALAVGGANLMVESFVEEAGQLRLRIEARSSDPVEIDVVPGSGGSLGVLRFDSETPSPEGTLFATTSGLRISHRGQGRYDLVLRTNSEASQGIVVRLRSAEETGETHLQTKAPGP